ncbi:filamentous hemagglutinin [Cupriavidus alkaliphilus]|nr:filamentous hemagglutinin [Cupriavidus alkaliphilus]
MLVAVEESASGQGKGRSAGSRATPASAFTGIERLGPRATVLAACYAMGVLTSAAMAQVVVDPHAGANRPAVVQTANGLQQVNITRPSTAGVSVNAYTQFDVPKAGVILNNSPSIVATRQAGYVNGNPNLLQGGSARIIVNQATGTLPSQLRGYLEVAGPRTEVIVANPNGILVDGAGFINTSRATLTTGMPVYGGTGSLDAYRVTGGQISVQGAGLNATSVDQVDLIARAVQVNASLYANNLNVIAGANQVDRTTLAATPVAGSGAAPALGIDVSQLGGMYANKILLASTEQGVGVSSPGVLAAQAGDLTLTAQGKLVLGGQTNAGGSLAITARDGIDQSGITYGAQSVSVSTGGTVSNSGTLAARQGLQIVADGIASTGTLGAGVDADGTVDQRGDLTLSTTGTISATGRNVAGGNASVQGASVMLAGSQTSAVGSLTLAAASGNLDLTGATTTAGAALNASAKGALVNDRGRMVSEGATTIAAGSVSNQGGQIVAKEAARIQTVGAVNNAQGIVQAGAALTVDAGTVDNSAGRLVSLNADGLAVTAAGALTNEAGTTATGDEGGMIGGNGNVQLAAGALINHGQVNAQGDARVQAGTLDNNRGSVSAGAALTAMVAGAASNRQGTMSAATLSLAAASLDNSGGKIEGGQLGIGTTGDLANRAGTIAQYGQAATAIRAGGHLDNTGGTVTANGSDLSVAGQTIVNDAGKVAHAGTGTLTVTSSGTLSNAGGAIQTNGDLVAQAETLANAGGAVSAQRAATIATRGALGNTQGTIYGGTGLAVASHGQVDNASGSIQSGGNLTAVADGALRNAAGTLTANGQHGQMNVSAASIDNAGGRLANAGDGATTVTSGSTIANTRGILGGNGALVIDAQALDNTLDGKILAGNALTLAVRDSIDNRGGSLYGGKGLTLDQAGATLANDGGSVLGGEDVSLKVASVSNRDGMVRANQDIAVEAAVSGSGEMTAGRDLTLDVVGDYANDAANKLGADRDMRVAATGDVTNTATLGAAGSLTVHGANVVNAAGARLNSAATLVEADNTITNAGRIEGDTVQVQSATFSNTGTVIGNQVKVQGAVVSNSGQPALIAAAQDLKIYASDSVSNVDGATLYSEGNLEIARDGARDAGGMLVNQVNVLTNRSATIEADGDIDIAAHAVSNTRTSIVAEAGTPVETARQTLSAWTAGLSITNWHYSITFPGWRWQGENAPVSAGMMNALAQPVTVEVPKSQVANLDTGAKTLSLTQPLTEEWVIAWPSIGCTDSDCGSPEPLLGTREIGTNPVQYYKDIEDTGTTYKITFWPDWNPATQIRPDQVRTRYDLGTDSHDYSEISRTVATTTATDRLVSASDPARIQAQGTIRINSDGGNIVNQSSIMAAGGDLVRRATGGTVQDTGTVLQQSVSTTETSTFYWHQKTGSNSDTQVVPYPTTPQNPTTVQALPAMASSNQAVQTTAQDVSVTTVNRVGQTVTGGGVSGGGDAGTAVGSASGQASRPQTLGTAQGGIPSLTLPTNGLFTYRTAPDAAYLIATDARFTQYKSFISSDYMLGELGRDPQKIQKRLGDGFYETKLIRDQVTALTGRTFLAGYTDQLEEYKALMTNGAAYAKSFRLTPGIGLSEQQMAQLTTDMVWLVAQDVTLADGSRQSVLVPKLYLAQANTVDLNASGALVLGNTVAVNATGAVQNSGRIVGDVATQVLGHDIVNRGAIDSLGDGSTVVQASQDVRNLGGRIAGKDVLVAAGRDVDNETQTITAVRTLANGYSAGSTGIGAVAGISATGTTAVLAGRDINQRGGAIDAGESALLAAGRDLNLGTVALGTMQDTASRGGRSYSHDQTTTHVGSTVQAGKNVVAVAGRDATLTGSSLQAGNNAALVAGRDTTVTAAIDTHTHREGSLGGKGAQYTQSSYDETARGSQVHAGTNATLAAGQEPLVTAVLQGKGLDVSPDAASNAGAGNLAVLGSSVSTGKDGNGGGTASLIAAGDVRIGTVSETHDAQNWSEQKKSGFLSKEQTTRESSQRQEVAVGSVVSADNVEGSAGRDLTIAGSTVAATHDVNLDAGRDLTITSAQNTSSSHSFERTAKSGLGATGSGLSYGKRDQKDTINDSALTPTASLVGSTDGSVHLKAGSALKVTGSELIAARDITGTGADVTVEAAAGTRYHDETHEVRQSGFTLGVSGGAIGAAINAGNKISLAGKSQDGRAAALWGIASARDAYDAGSALANGANPVAGAAVTLSFGSSQSKQTLTEQSTTHTSSRVTAGGNAAFVAIGVDANGNQTAGNLNIVGSDVSAAKVALSAKRDVNIVSATDTEESHSTNKSSSASVGISYGAQGFGVSASASKAKGNSDSAGATQVNSHVTGSDTVTIASGNDTTILGGVVSGSKVSADVGGDLNLASRQDTQEMHARQQSMGGGFSISQGGGSASFSASKGKADGSYANVSEQSSIRAGHGGFDIQVKGNTDLKGGVIASTGGADKNRLTTGTLSWSDVQNRSDYRATSGGISAGGAFGSPVGQSNSGPTSGSNTAGIGMMVPQHDSGSQRGVGQAGVSAGTINITVPDNQKQDLASLNRDTVNTNSTVGKNPDVANTLNKQADMMAAAQSAGEAVARTVGDIATNKQKEAQKAFDQAKAAYEQDPSDGNRAAMADAQTAIDGWKEGGGYRAALHAAGGALVAGLGGGNALAGAAAAGASSLAAPALETFGNLVADSVDTGNAGLNEALGNLAANIAAGGLGVVVGGGAGAAMGTNVDRFNRQLHQSEYDFAKKNAKVVAQKLGISEREAEGRIVAEILRNSDKETADAADGKHDYEVRSIVGCLNLNCDGSKTDPNYSNPDYNSQHISGNQTAYDRGQQNIGTGLTEVELRDKNLVYERIGKGALAATACVASGGAACQAAATGLGAAGAINYVTGSSVSTAEAIGAAMGGAVGASYGANLNSWAGEVGAWFEKVVLGITKAAPIFAGKQIGVPVGNATSLGGSLDPLLDPATNSWWGLDNTIKKIKEEKQ